MARTPSGPGGRPQFALIAAALAGVLVLVAGLLIAVAFRDSSNGSNPLAGVIGGKFTLVDQDGKTFTDADLKGKWQLVFFGYTHCPDVCPTALNDLSLALDELGAKKSQIGIVFISVDPARDTPDVLKSYVGSFGAPIVALTGTDDQVKQAAQDYKVFYAKHPRADGGYDMDHSALIYVMDPQGRFTATFTPDDKEDAIVKRLQKLLS